MEGEYGIIPGSMGVGSFIVKGKGNPESWSSCSHGAGRRMSRTKAFGNISQEEFVKSMEGIVCDHNEHLRDEAPAAYKDLTTVMANQVVSAPPCCRNKSGTLGFQQLFVRSINKSATRMHGSQATRH